MDVSGNIAEFRKDNVFSGFLNESFNLQQCIAGIKDLSFNEQLEKISFGIEFVKQNISNLTSQNCEEFFQRTAQLDSLYQELQFIQIRSQSLSKTMDSIKSKLENPYQELTTEISNLSFAQKSCDLLRKMLRIIHLSKRIYQTNLKAFRTENDTNVYQRELIKTSQYLSEVNTILDNCPTSVNKQEPGGNNSNDLYKLVAIADDLKKIEAINQEVLLEADRLIKDGLERLSESTVGTSLLVFYNLGVLGIKIDGLVNGFQALAGQCLQRRLNNPKQLHAPMDSELLQQKFRESLEDIEKLYSEMFLVFRVLKKKRDNLNQKLLFEYLDDGERAVEQFWNQSISSLSAQLLKICQERPKLKALFEENYHQLLTIVIEFQERILELESSIKNGRNARNVIHCFESSYLSSSINGLFETVNNTFKVSSSAQSSSQSSLSPLSSTSASALRKSSSKKLVSIPQDSEVDKIIDKIKSELLLSVCDPGHLLPAISRNAQQAANLFIVKCEHLALVDGDASQVIGQPTKSQLHNVQLIHCLKHFEGSLRKLFQRHVNLEDLQGDFGDVYKSINSLVSTVVEPLMASLTDALEAIILTMHSESYAFQKPEVGCSLYIRELQSFLQRSWNDYLKPLNCIDDCDIIQEQIYFLANKTIDTFALNSCLLSPVSVFGRHRIHQDFDAFERSIEPLCDRTGSQSNSFQVLRALKSVILLPPDTIKDSPTIGNPIPVSLVVTFLLSNYGQGEICMQKYLDYSSARYLKWFQSTETEVVVERIKECLDGYAKKVRRENRTNYLEIYPILVDLMKKA